MNTKIICNFIESNNKEALFGYEDGIVRLIRDNDIISVEYKDNVGMDDFCWALGINCDDVKPSVVAKTIVAFIKG